MIAQIVPEPVGMHAVPGRGTYHGPLRRWGTVRTGHGRCDDPVPRQTRHRSRGFHLGCVPHPVARMRSTSPIPTTLGQVMGKALRPEQTSPFLGLLAPMKRIPKRTK